MEAPAANREPEDRKRKREEEGQEGQQAVLTKQRTDVECPICMTLCDPALFMGGECECAQRMCVTCARTLWLDARAKKKEKGATIDDVKCPFCRGTLFSLQGVEVVVKELQCAGCHANVHQGSSRCPTETCEDHEYYPSFMQFVSGEPPGRTTRLQHARSLVSKTLRLTPLQTIADTLGRAYLVFDAPFVFSCSSGATETSNVFKFNTDGSLESGHLYNGEVEFYPYGSNAPSWKPLCV